MSRSLTELAALTQDELLTGIVDKLMTVDETLAVFLANSAVTDRPTIKYNRLDALPTTAVVDCSTSFASQAISASPLSVNLLTYAVQYSVCDIGTNLYSSFADLMAQETEGAIKSLGNKISTDSVGAGNGSTAIFGLSSWNGNSVNCATSGSFDISDLDVVIDAMKGLKNDRCFFVGAPVTVRKVLNELRSEAVLQWQDVVGTAFRAPAYQGYSILKNDSVATGSLFFVDPVNGFKLFFGSSQDQSIGGVFNLQSLGESQTKLEKIARLYAHVAGVSLNPLGLCELSNVL